MHSWAELAIQAKYIHYRDVFYNARSSGLISMNKELRGQNFRAKSLK